jgi:hypothetical protein
MRFHADEGDYSGALALLSNESNWNSLSQIVDREEELGGDWELLDSSDEIWLQAVAEGDSEFNHLAKAVLGHQNTTMPDPIPVFPIQYRTLNERKKTERTGVPLLGAWPNPTNGDAYLHYPVEADGIGLIRIFDPMGKWLRDISLNHFGLVDIHLGNLPNGLYVFQLVVEERTLESIRVTLIH